MDDGEIVNVLVELETDGEVDIWIQVLKLSEDTWIEPEHDEFDELDVTELESIVSEKVTEIEEHTEIEVSLLDGDIDETVGGVVSGWIPVVNPFDVSYWLLKLFPELSFIPVVIRILYIVE